MKLLVGLGNPGEKYDSNRHNVGFIVLDCLMSKINDSSWQKSEKFESLVFESRPEALLAKPQTFMNNSGKAVRKLVNYYKIKTPDLWVIHDDLDIKLGQYKIQNGRGPKLHYGVNSVEESLGSVDFWRVRVGVDNRDSQSRISGEDYVLQNFTKEENVIVNETVGKICEELAKWINQK